MYNGKKVLVTGSSGFVGHYLVKSLIKTGAEVYCVDVLKGDDLTIWDDVKKIKKFDLAFHLAALSYVPLSYKSPRDFLNVNINSTLNILELCKIYNARMIFASSYVYGKPQYLPIDEEHPVASINPYSQSKIICEMLCKTYYKDFGIETIIIRPSNIYGKGLNDNFLIPTIINQLKSGKVQLNDSKPKRDFIYIDDLVQLYLLAGISKIKFETVNAGSGESISVKNLAELIISVSQTNSELLFGQSDRPNEVLETVYNINKAKKLLGWQPKFDIESGLKCMLS